MKKLYMVLICLALILVVFGVTNDDIFTIDYWLSYAQEVGKIEVPHLTGGYDISGDFDEASLAVGHMLLYPLIFCWWILKQVVLFCTYFLGGAII